LHYTSARPSIEADAESDVDFDLRRYARVLRRRKWVILASLVVCVAGAVVYSRQQTPIYKPTAQLLLATQPGDPLAAPSSNVQDAARKLNNEVQQLLSAPAVAAVRNGYKGKLDPSKVQAAPSANQNADVIYLSLTDPDPKAAANLVNQYANLYIAYRSQKVVDDLLAAGKAVTQKLNDTQHAIEVISTPLTDFSNKIQGAPDDKTRQALTAQRAALLVQLQPQLTPLQNQLTFYQQQLDKVTLSAGVQQAGTLDLLLPASSAAKQISPKPVRNGAVALFVGLLIGVGIALLLEYLDDSIRSRETLETLSGLPVVGVIPKFPSPKGSDPADIVAVTQPRSIAAEAFRTLRAAVKFLNLDKPVRVFQITSPAAREGKTMTAANLAAVMAQAGERVVIVGCDLRNPRLDMVEHVPDARPGLTSVLLGDANLSDAIWEHPDTPGLWVLPTGPTPPFPAEMLEGQRMGALVEALAGTYDMVILDCAPTLPVADALIVSRWAQATLVVAAQGRTSRRGFRRALQLLRQVHAPLIGTILNEASDREDDYGYGYGYGYGYYGPDENGNGDGKKRRKSKSDRGEPDPEVMAEV
jgi:succinoglycan biosynthesis transport protein ExoP